MRPSSLIQAVHLTPVKDRRVAELAYGQQRQLEIALALAGAPRFILFDEPAAGLSPTERRELIEILTSLPRAYRLHHHRARHGRRAARGRERHDDAQRPHLQGRRAAGDRSPIPRCRSFISEAAMSEPAAPRAPPSRSAASTSTTAIRTRCRASISRSSPACSRWSAATAWARPRCARPSWACCAPAAARSACAARTSPRLAPRRHRPARRRLRAAGPAALALAHASTSICG